jgi:flavorubredoxin
MEDPFVVAGDVHVLASSETAPGYGVLPVNAYLIGGDDPVLVDTGLPSESEEFLEALWSLVEPEDLRWVFLTHEDPDHAGNLLAVLEAAPDARLVTNYVTVGKLREGLPSVPIERVVVVNPGEPFPGTGRGLRVVRPPVYDAPGTIGLHDPVTGVVLTVDAFGTYLPELVDDLGDVPEDDARSGFEDFNRANHPWVTVADRARFDRSLAELRRLDPILLLSSHGVPARGRTDDLLDAMARLPRMDPYEPPDQQQFEELREEMGG